MIRAERIWRLQRASGIAAMLLLSLSLVVLFDGLRAGIFRGDGQVRLVPGEQYAVSGPMPPKTERIEDFVIDSNAFDGSLRLVPEVVFSGYLFGGAMWRGHIVADSHPRPGRYVLKVRDKFGEKQNPALVFTVRVFADQASRQAHSLSLVTRFSGANPYWLAACCALAGLFAGGWNYLLGVKWHGMLAELGCAEICRLRKVDGHYEAVADMRRCDPGLVGSVFRLTHPRRGNIGEGLVIGCMKGEVTIRVAADVPVRPGDIACPVTV